MTQEDTIKPQGRGHPVNFGVICYKITLMLLSRGQFASTEKGDRALYKKTYIKNVIQVYPLGLSHTKAAHETTTNKCFS